MTIGVIKQHTVAAALLKMDANKAEKDVEMAEKDVENAEKYTEKAEEKDKVCI